MVTPVPLFTPEGHLHIDGLIADASRLDTWLHDKEAARRVEKETRTLRSSALLREELHYTLAASWYAIELVTANAAVAASRLASELPAGGLRTLGHEGTMPFSAAVDLYFSSMRRGQNCLVGYASKTIKSSLPSSASDLVKNLKRDAHDLDEVLKDLIVAYWDEHGASLKSYRDLAQHKAVVTSDCRISRSAGGRLRFFCALPNNPDIDDPKRLSYDPAVEVLPYMLGAFVGHVRFARKFTQRLVEIVRQREPAACLGKTLMSMEFKAGLPFAPIGEAGTEVRDLADLRGQLATALG